MAVTSRFLVERNVGRLVEARIWRLNTAEDADDYAAAVIAAAAAGEGKPVLCADHRAANIYPPVVADRLALAFLPNNNRFERIAIVALRENALLLMQLQRLTREAGTAQRRVCLEPSEAIDHLKSGLNADELSRAMSFLTPPAQP